MTVLFCPVLPLLLLQVPLTTMSFILGTTTTTNLARSPTISTTPLYTSSSPSSSSSSSSARTTTTTTPPSPRELVNGGMRRFEQADVKGSIESFDAADRTAPYGSLTPYLWQRGISYYYDDDFQKGSLQFKFDVSVNPLDVEEIVWDIACLARLDPSTFPPKAMMSLPKGKKDRRKIMGTVYSLFRGEATEQDLAAAGQAGKNSFGVQGVADEFYSLFYLGLYCEARGETSKAAKYMRSAAMTTYATGVGAGDYMTSCARVHCKIRGWI